MVSLGSGHFFSENRKFFETFSENPKIFRIFREFFGFSENFSDYPKIFRIFRNYFGFSEIISDFPRMRFFCSEECVTDVRRARTCFPGGNMSFRRSLTLFIIVSAGAIPL